MSLKLSSKKFQEYIKESKKISVDKEKIRSHCETRMYQFNFGITTSLATPGIGLIIYGAGNKNGNSYLDESNETSFYCLISGIVLMSISTFHMCYLSSRYFKLLESYTARTVAKSYRKALDTYCKELYEKIQLPIICRQTLIGSCGFEKNVSNIILSYADVDADDKPSTLKIT